MGQWQMGEDENWKRIEAKGIRRKNKSKEKDKRKERRERELQKEKWKDREN